MDLLDGYQHDWVPVQLPLYDNAEMERERLDQLGTVLTERITYEKHGTLALLTNVHLHIHDGTFAARHLSPHINHLTHVLLRNNWMRDRGLEPVLKVLLAAPFLRELDISRTGFFGAPDTAPSFYALVRNTLALKALALSDNDVCLGFGDLFGPTLACNTTLEHLNLANTELRTEGWSCILSAIRRHPRLIGVSFSQFCANINSGPVAEDAALVLRDNAVLKSLRLDGVHMTAESMVKMLRALHYNTCLTDLTLGNVKETLSSAHDIGQAVSELLVPNVTLQELYFTCGSSHVHAETRQMLKRNLGRVCSRAENARRAVMVLDGLRRFRSLPAMRYIDRGIMRIIGRCILATKLRPEWEDPALWPVDAAGVRIKPLTAEQGAKRRRHAIPGTRIGPWVMNLDGEWERRDDDNDANAE